MRGVRILLVGDYDLGGVYLASRFYREGHHVCWLTQEPDLALWGKEVKTYRRPATYSACHHILVGEAIDGIVFLTAPYREPVEEAGKSSLLALLDPVLRAAATCKLRWTCLLSSTDLEEEGLLSPTLEELRAGERVLSAFCRQHQVPLLILRLGCLFGEAPPSRAGLAGAALSAMAKGEKVFCPFREDAQFDFVCGPDLADAALRMMDAGAAGTYRAVTGKPVTAGELYRMAGEATGSAAQVEFGKAGHSAPPLSLGQPLREVCGWMPFYLFAEAGPAYLHTCAKLAGQEKAGPRRQVFQRLKRRAPLLFETLQNLLLFAVMLLLSSYTAGWNDLRYVDVRLLYVVIVAISFGMRQGIFATVLAILSYAATLLQAQIDISYLLYSVESWIPFIVYGVAGAFGGYWSDKKRDDYDSLNEEFTGLGERYQFLKGLYRDVVDVKNQLQRQIVVSRDSLGRLYSITEELSSPSPRMVYVKTIQVIEEIMECNSVALYLLPGSGGFGRLMACSAPLAEQLAPSKTFQDLPKLQAAVKGHSLFVNTELDGDYPAMAMPIFDEDSPVALAVLYLLGPSQYTVYYKNLFQTLGLMIQNSLARAFHQQEEAAPTRCLPGTTVLNATAFAQELDALRLAQEELSCPVSVAKVAAQTAPRTSQEATALYKKAAALLRGTDVLGLGEDGALYAAFLYVGPSRRPILEQRFANNGFTLHWED